MTVSQQDIDVRLQLITCKYADLANKYSNALKWGLKESVYSWKKLILLDAYVSLIKDYDVNNPTKNCITQDQLIVMFDKISEITNICFKPFNFTYTQFGDLGQFDDSFSDSFL